MSNELSMMNYIYETPEYIINNIENRVELTSDLVLEYINSGSKDIIIVACGSSYNGSLFSRYFLRDILGVEVKLITPFTFMHHEYRDYDNSFLVNVSQSGCSVNSIQCMQFEKSKKLKVITLVGRDDCDAKKYSDLLINWGCGEEKIGYATKGVVTLSLFWMLFGLEVAKRKNIIDTILYNDTINQLKKTASLYKELVKEASMVYSNYKEKIVNCDSVYLISSGPNLSTSIEGGLKIAETNCIPCIALEVEEYLHGPIYPLTPRTLLVFIDNNSDDSSNRILQVANSNIPITDCTIVISNSFNNSNAVNVRTSEETLAYISPLYKIAFLQTLAYLRTLDTNNYKPHENVIEYERYFRSDTKTRLDLIIDQQGL